ncbi:MAG: hypothetical protein APF76_08240 [Desulfitibacter sp. BRH_c19]|nr:MAG: hypothetical protein APF76_08240 [Desulfitibacter sp. BRH_c19]
MNYYVKFSPESLVKTIEDLFLIYFPFQKISEWTPGNQCHFEIKYQVNDTKIIVKATSHWQKEITITEVREEMEEHLRSQLRRLVRLAFYKLLLELFKQDEKPWGILTGVRPTKVVHRLLDQGLGKAELDQYLRKEFCLSDKKIQVVKEVVQGQKKLFKQISKKQIGINLYIGIPFCPSRCLYCSFPAYEVKKFSNRINGYLEALKKEIKEFLAAIEDFDINVESIYIGGGTPTVLNSLQLEGLLKTLAPLVSGYNLKEYTLEAGRPDTIEYDKLKIAKEYGVTRVSVNPQTMKQETLDLIGRLHAISQIYEAVSLVHKLQLKLNMDLILGLPGESSGVVKNSTEKLIELKPHNITAHILAIKTASKLRRIQVHLPEPSEVSDMYYKANQILRENGFDPYYLYRQKRSLGDLENTGYSLKGEESWYNVMMMEERQTIIGFGAGAASKFIHQDAFNIHGVYYNPKDSIIYGQRENLVRDKVKLLLEVLTNKSTIN